MWSETRFLRDSAQLLVFLDAFIIFGPLSLVPDTALQTQQALNFNDNLSHSKMCANAARLLPAAGFFLWASRLSMSKSCKPRVSAKVPLQFD